MDGAPPEAPGGADRPNYGPYSSEDAALRAIVEKLVGGLGPRAVYLFGSRAEHRARPDSDFDVIVVLDDRVAAVEVSFERVYEPLRGSGIGCDVVPCYVSEFEEVLRDPTNPWHRSWVNARKLYERP